MGAIDVGFEDPVKAAKGADLIVLCTPVLMLSPLLKQIAPALNPGALVTDVGSTKGSIVRDAATLMPATAAFVGSHPMAGSEKRGVQYAKADLFDGAMCIVTPTASTSATALGKVDDFWRLLGMHVTHMDAEVHDRAVSDISHLPHLLAAALMAMQSEASLAVAGRGFADMTRIAAGDGGLWRDILLDNRERVRESLSDFKAQIAKIESLLDADDLEGVKQWLDQAAARREQMKAKKEPTL